MTLLDKIAAYLQHGDRVERARDPETHEEYPSPTWSIKLLAYFAKTPWAWRQFMKWVTAGVAILTAWIVSHGGQNQSDAIATGIIAAASFLGEQIISYLCHKAGIPVPDFGQPTATPDPASASPFLPARCPTPRPSIFRSPPPPYDAFGNAMEVADYQPEPETKMPEPDPIRTVPRSVRATQLMPLGVPGAEIIAESRDGAVKSPDTQVRGSLRCEADDGKLVVLTTDSGVRTLERTEWKFYVSQP